MSTARDREMTMRITVFGASGRIGSTFIDLASERGHTIRGVYRTPPRVPPHGQVEIMVDPDIFKPVFVARAIRGADAVVTALGPDFARRHNPMSRMISARDIHQRLARSLISVIMDSGDPTKVISVSTGSMGPGDAAMGLGPRILFRVFRTIVARNLQLVGRDLAAMEKELASSGLDWYAVRPIKLTDGPLTRRVEASESFTMRSISRADVAWYMLAIAEDAEPRYRTPIIVSAQTSPA